MNIGDLFWTFRGDGARLQADAKTQGAKAGTTLGQSITDGLKKSWNGQEIGKGLIQGLGLAGGLGAAKLVANGVDAIRDGLVGTITSAIEFEKAMANVNSIAKMTDAQLKDTGDSVLDLSQEFGQSATTLAEGLYDISSSGFQGADAMKVLASATKAATAGLSTTKESASGITAVLNAYGKSAADAADVSDVLFETVNRGVISFPELSAQIGKTTALAAPLGVSLEEVAAAAALMTRNGVQAEDTFTQINAVMSSMLQPSKEAAELAADIGLQWDASALKANGLVKQMSLLVEKTGGSSEKMATLLGDARAIRGAFVLAKNAGADFTSELAAMGKAAGATDDAFAEQSKSTAFHIAQMQAKIEAARIEIGEKFLPIISSLADVGAKVLVPTLNDIAGGLDLITSAGKEAGGVLQTLGLQSKDASEGGFDFVHSIQDLLAVTNPTKVSNTLGVLLDTVDKLGVSTSAARDELSGFGLDIDTQYTSVNQLLDRGADNMSHASEVMVGATDDVGDASQDMAKKVKSSAHIVTTTWAEMKKAVVDAARELIDKAFGPIIAQDRLAATEAEIAAQRRILASSKSTDAEKRDAKSRLHELGQDNAQYLVELAEAGKTNSKAYKDGLKELRREIKNAKGPAKAALQEVLDKILEIERVGKVVPINIRVNSKGNIGVSGARASGGPELAGRAYWVGERGPELHVPETNGRILSASQSIAAMSAVSSDGAGGDTIQVNLLDRMPMRSVRDIGDGLRMLERRGYLRRRETKVS